MFIYKAPRKIVSGPRVYLRPPWSRDQKEWLNLRTISQDFLQPWEPKWQNDALTARGFRKWLDFAQHGLRTMTDLPLLIFHHDSRLLGGITLKEMRWGVARSVGLGYWIGKPYAQRGFMREAVALIGIHCFERMGFNRIEAACMPRNQRSANLLKNLHFQFEGHLRQFYCINGFWEDHHLYSLLAQEISFLQLWLKNSP